MSEDARITKTKLAIRQAFLNLLAEKPIEKISVAQLIQVAGINRGTFYAHYQDKFDLLDQVEQEAKEEPLTYTKEQTGQSLQENWDQGDSFAHILPILTYVEKNHALFHLLAEGKLSCQWFDEVVTLYLQKALPESDPQDPWLGYKKDILVASTIATVNRWILGGYQEDKEDLAAWMTETEQLLLFDHS